MCVCVLRGIAFVLAEFFTFEDEGLVGYINYEILICIRKLTFFALMLYNLKSGVSSVFKQLKVGLDIQCMCSNLQQNGAMLRGMSTQIIFLVSGASLMFN